MPTNPPMGFTSSQIRKGLPSGVSKRARGEVVQDLAFQYNDSDIGEYTDQRQQEDGDKHHRGVGRTFTEHQQVA